MSKMSTDILIKFKETQNLTSENFSFLCNIAVTEAISMQKYIFDSGLSVFDRTSRVFHSKINRCLHFNIKLANELYLQKQ